MKAWLATIGIAIIGILGAFLGGNARGKAKARQQAAESVIRDVETAKDVEETVKRDSPLERRRKLRKWASGK